MKTNFSIISIFLVILVSAFPKMSLAYGSGGSSKKSCAKPQFSKMTPAAKSVVPPASEFSFQASAKTNRKSLKVTIKGQEVDFEIDPLSAGRMLVKGKFPETITEGFARINISATSTAKCRKQDGWLVMIGTE